ncbi:signal transduction histidine kinase [Herbihabitans rhizosphaerae]|uniref:Signal transduction histidine kinase n=1 Tax=Herbihabitans rhizosphaerae TaxID=1872711 RepID=A0A4Q7KWC5_9PSEU|nr:signal transduction histidine kinase [Herbihabitans rhizosphaerae]
MTSSDTGSNPSFWLWDLYFAAGLTFAIGLNFAVDGDTTTLERLGTAGALVGLCAWYAVFGRRLVLADDQGPKAVVFLAGVLLLFGVSVAFQPRMTVGLFAVFPMIFMSVPLRVALPAVVVAGLTPTVMVVIREGSAWETIQGSLVTGVFAMVFSVMIGTWIIRIAEQSEDRAELIQELEASREEVARLSHETGTAAERARLAREIHDTLAQGFTSIVALTQAVESELDTDPAAARRHLDLVNRTARENLAEARAMVAALTPSELADSLADAVRRRATRLGEQTGVTVRQRIEALPPLPTAAEVVVLRAAQEALSNVAKHARASTVDVVLSGGAKGVRLAVADDGVGFDPSTVDNGYGLRGMRARAEQVGGTVTVHSGQKGTTVELVVPL